MTFIYRCIFWLSRTLVILMAGALCLNLGSNLRAAVNTLYAAEALDEDTEFFTVNPANSSATFVYDPDVFISGLAVHLATGVIYGSTAGFNVGSSFNEKTLVTIDPTLNQITEIGFVMTLNDKPLTDLTFDPFTNVLYGWEGGANGDLYTVNLATDNATLVGESGLTLSGGNALPFAGNTLYLAGNRANGLLYTIDKTTGQPTGSVLLGGGNDKIPALTFDGSTLYGVDNTNDLFTIDPANGQLSFIGDTFQKIDAIAFADTIPEPALSTWFLAILAVVCLFVKAVRNEYPEE